MRNTLQAIYTGVLFDSRIPYTANNSSASILLNGDVANIDSLFDYAKRLMLAHFVEGSDSGLAIATEAHADIIHFGKRAKTEIVTQAEAQALAEKHAIRLAGLGGTNGGIIGALASIGLAASGNDGRYIRVGTIRDLTGLQPIETLQAAGIAQVKTVNDDMLYDGLVYADNLRPLRRNGQPVLYVEPAHDGHWQPLKID